MLFCGKSCRFGNVTYRIVVTAWVSAALWQQQLSIFARVPTKSYPVLRLILSLMLPWGWICTRCISCVNKAKREFYWNALVTIYFHSNCRFISGLTTLKTGINIRHFIGIFKTTAKIKYIPRFRSYRVIDSNGSEIGFCWVWIGLGVVHINDDHYKKAT